MRYQVTANRYKRNGQVSKKRIVLASFLIQTDAYYYLDMRIENEKALGLRKDGYRIEETK